MMIYLLTCTQSVFIYQTLYELTVTKLCLKEILLFSANKIVQRIGPERPQTIILTGVSGSGKTRSAANILTYLGNSSLSDHTKQRILSTNSIFEYFGNAATCLNGDSSRFSKLTEVSITFWFCHLHDS